MNTRSLTRGRSNTHRPRSSPPRRSALFSHFVRLPFRYWTLDALALAAIELVIAPAVRGLLDAAVSVAGLTYLSDRNVSVLLASPGSVAMLLGVVAIILVVTLAWVLLLFAGVDVHLSGADPSIRTVVSRAGGMLRRSAPAARLVAGIQFAFVGPLIGFGLFAPLTSGLLLPPFIGREFLKAPLTAFAWCAIAAVLIYASYRAILVLPLAIAGGARGWHALPASVRATGLGASRFALALTMVCAAPTTVTWLVATSVGPAVDLVASRLPFLASIGSGLLELLVAVLGLVSAQLVAIVLIDRARAVAGRPAGSAARPRDPRRAPVREAVPIAVVVALVAVAGANPFAASPAAAAVPTADGGALVIGHRGEDSGGVENTIGGLEAAARDHPDVVEVDIQQTSDGGFVASHDTNLLVLAGKDENIYDMTTAQATSTVVTMKGHSDTIPTMAEYVERARALELPLLIELKVTGHERPDYVANVLSELATIDGLRGNSFHSLDPDVVRTIKERHPELRVGLTIAMLSGPLPGTPCDFYVVEQASITAATITAAHREGRAIYAWTVDSALRMRELLREGIDGLVTDHPVLAQRSRQQVAQSPTSVRDDLLSISTQWPTVRPR
ncbi:glycerophosphodiester phosphodiesterase family protein [Leifsonia sp. NPDC058194]|uniref:glycerophosphodiester phosphodiesterase family protein n=1 Tax=Leifsonia sp. NPDC058194 TaxID=3346374 RepID=UPI0036DE6282